MSVIDVGVDLVRVKKRNAQCPYKYTKQIKMSNFIKDLHTVILTGPRDCGKIRLVLAMIEKEYSKHFDYIIVICLTFR